MFQNKLVAVVNKQVDTGVVMNALAHMCLGFGAQKGASQFHLMDYKTADGYVYPSTSKDTDVAQMLCPSREISNLFCWGWAGAGL